MVFESITTSFGSINWNSALWMGLKIFLIIAISLIMAFGIIWALKRRKFVYPVIILRNVGEGKTIWTLTKAAKLRTHKIFFNMIDSKGEYELITRTGIKIIKYSDTDMQLIFGNMGFIVVQKPDDPKVLVPISTTHIENYKLMMDIASADFADAALEKSRAARRELLSWAEQMIPYISLIIVAVMAFLIFVITFQWATGTIKDITAAAVICKNVVAATATAVQSTVAP